MPTVNTTQPFTDVLQRGNVLSVVCSSAGSAQVVIQGSNRVPVPAVVGTGLSQSFGPYGEDVSVTVNMFSGSADVNETTPNPQALARVATDSSNNPVGLNVGGQTLTNTFSNGSNLVAALGDSITEYSVLGGQQVNFVGYLSHGFMTWAMALSMGALWCPMVCTYKVAGATINYNRGKSGETAEQCLARVSELDALPVRPRFCSILIGTNNLTVNPTQTASSIMATIVSIVQAVQSRGITPVLCTLLPRGNGSAAGWGSLSAGQITTARGRLMEINRQIRAYAGSNPGVILADLFYSILDMSSATSDPIAAYTGGGTGTPDYVHPNATGALPVGDTWWQAVKPYVNAAPRMMGGSGDGYNATENPYGSVVDSSWATGAANAGTGVSGTGPNGWTCARNVGTSSTAVITRQARADGKVGNEASIAMTSVGENAVFITYAGAGSIANFANGDAFYLEAEATFNTASGDFYGNPDVYIRSTTDDSGAYAWNMTACNNNNGVSGAPFGSYTVLLRTPITICAQGQRSMNAWLIDGVANGKTATSVRRNVRIARYNRSGYGSIPF